MSELIDKKEERLLHDMTYITKSINSKLKSLPTAIYLCGGYGRGEGAWIESEGGQFSPYNDYDLAVFTDNPLTSLEYSELRKEIANRIGISWIDIDFYSLSSIYSLATTIKNIDLLYASRLIFGEDILSSASPIDARKIGTYDVLKLYRTRIWTFLGSWDGAFRNLNIDESRFFKNQMAKAILAACDMILISNNQYTPRYSDRVELVNIIQKKDLYFCQMATWALHEKLKPSDDCLTEGEMRNLYFGCKKIFDSAFKMALNHKHTYFENPYNTKKYYVLHTTYLLHDMFNKIIRKSKQVEKSLDLFLIQNYVFRANQEGTVNSEYVKEAVRLLKKWNYAVNAEYSWDEIHLIVADARNNAYEGK